MSETARFLSTLWTDDGPEDGLITLWTLPTRRVQQAEQPAAAAVWAEDMASRGEDVYVAVASVARVANGRGRAEDSRLLPGLALDFDVAGPGRKKPVFPTREAALAFIERLPLRGSVLVDSGGGYQVWWLFREPITAAEAAPLARAWLWWVQREARIEAVEIDAVADMARVLRLPGTLNNKYGEPRPVRVVREDALARYSPDDFAMFRVDDTGAAYTNGSGARQPLTVGGLVLDARAVPPLKIFDLIQVDAKFRMTWERRRKDLRDTSPSGYDMSLASFTVAAGWTDQEIADTLIAARARNGDDLKLREDYYRRTIDNIRRSRSREETLSEVEATGGISVLTDEGRARVFDLFSAQTGAKLVGLARSYPKGDLFIFTFDSGQQVQVPITTLTNWRSFWETLSVAGCQPNTSRPKESVWLALVNTLVSIAERMDVEVSREGGMLAVLIARLARASQIDIDDPVEANAAERYAAIRSCGAFYYEGRIWIRLKGLLAQAEQMRYAISSSALRATLKILDADKRLIVSRIDERRQAGGRCYGVTIDQLHALSDVDTAAGAAGAAQKLAGEADPSVETSS